MPSFIGLIMLMGIAIKNSILLVDYAVMARHGHDGHDGQPVVAPMSRFDALMDACHKRARPIIMTSIAMGAGMLPIALGLGAADSSFRAPMSVAVIGGLMTSTILSLVVIPPVFTVFDDFEQWVRKGFRRLRGKH
jgi:multidrug efflux pump subunit AcrB